MNKKIVFLMIMSIWLTTYNAVGQINFLTSEQVFIKKATSNAIYIVRQDYKLKDTSLVNPNEYGMGGHDYFGRIYRLAVLSENKLWCESSIKEPWNFDPNYNEYKDNKAINPILGKTAIRKINETFFKNINISQVQTTDYDSLLLKLNIATLNFKAEMSGIKNLKEKKDGEKWIILASTKENIKENDSCYIKLSIYKFPLSFTGNNIDMVVKKPTITKNLLGGFFINNEISTGKVEFFFSGILIKQANQWQISLIPDSNNSPKKDTTLNIIVQEKDYTVVQFVHEDGFPLKELCNIKIKDSKIEYCTNKSGIIKIPLRENNMILLLNDKRAACLKKGETIKVVCKYSGGKFIPKKIIKQCK